MLEVGPVLTTPRPTMSGMDSRVGRVYLITNKVNGKQYIGFTSKTVETRWKAHVKGGPDSAKRLHRAVVEFGPAAFVVETVFQGTTGEALAQEHELIMKYNTFADGYNGSEGGEAPYLDKTTPLEVRAKISESLKGNKFNLGKKASAEARANMSKSHLGNKSNLGRRLPDEHRANISSGLKGKLAGVPKSAEHIEKIRLAKTGTKLSVETKAKIGAASRGNKYCLGFKHPAETRARWSAERKAAGRLIGNTLFLGRKHSAEAKAKQRASALVREATKRAVLASVLGINPDIEKYCSKCRAIKLKTEFYRTRRTYDGRHRECKTCST